ncbi:MAG TPA: PLP-dependent aminotransferase family protein [Solirubrobacteraceae bacterium]|jgi:GntR family transcriptional regulator/MocR family aminotransferase|nr:PLP-dependent aminotransferase family protein [Solirubrobacteraceae bacterium]
MITGANSGPELLVELDRSRRRPLRSQLEDGLREAVRSGRLAAQARLPASRALAADLGVSRRLVVDAYSQLLAEGYLIARSGAGTYVADAAAAPSIPAAEHPSSALSFDFFPGYPDLTSFPRRPWLRAMREVLATAPAASLGYPDERGELELRRALAGHLRRVRGVAVDPQTIVVCSGAAQALVLLARALGGPHLAIEDPGLPPHREILAAHGARLAALAVDADGAEVRELAAIEARGGRVDAVFVTPAHQSPTGVALAPARRAALLDWAGATGGLVIEDDYDAEYRYDRPPLAALQGLAPDRVIYMGTASKTLAPAVRLGWLVLPAGLVERVARQRALADHGAPTLDQLALARLIETGAYERHLRQARRRYRARRDALVDAVAAHIPDARVTGLAAGLHVILRLAGDVDGMRLARAAAHRSVGVYPLGYAYMEPRPVHDSLVLGYANLSEPAIGEGIRRLSDALREIEKKRSAR